jgi:thiol-disulfide isomerase/thioredoxin
MSLPGEVTTITGGVSRIMIDPESGAWLVCHVTETIEQGSGLTYQLDITYSVKHMTYVAAPDPALFRLPDNLHEVHELARWDEKRIKKELLGKPAPGLQVTDIRGNHLSLADLRGKTVLLDFWTTWCPPCRADAPILDELNQKYGKDLTIIGVSVDEDRATVKKFLEKHPHAFPVVLSTENSMPRPYQIGVFPTYLIIGPDGTITAAEQGDQGFSRLRKSLEKAGMQME